MQKAEKSEAFETWLRSNHLSFRFTKAFGGPRSPKGSVLGRGEARV
jgi:hypothetical protein